MSARTEMS